VELDNPVYLDNRTAVFDAATKCGARGRPTVAKGSLLTREYLERAFAEWQEERDGSDVTMELETGSDGAVAAKFTPGAD
jgi:hypothetical protein